MTEPAFSPCPSTPNCVSSLETRTSHSIEPLSYQGASEEAKQRLLDVINGFPRTRVLEVRDTYIHATFTSFLFRFTDDVEFLIDDTKKLIHMKSASRVGFSDIGANRRRCEAVRDRFNR
ncbi:MAG: DUF1499 domain-containing protein [Halieaceae bacterium]|jgi:uncharacterized protein (DUF1499 family)|nr:DUF1499 domain-containing protein [Halieaceae bacterium]